MGARKIKGVRVTLMPWEGLVGAREVLTQEEKMLISQTPYLQLPLQLQTPSEEFVSTWMRRTRGHQLFPSDDNVSLVDLDLLGDDDEAFDMEILNEMLDDINTAKNLEILKQKIEKKLEALKCKD